LYLSSGAYDLEDANGALLHSGSMLSVYPQVIEPGEKAYYYEETTLDGVDDAGIEVNFLPRPDVAKAKVDNVRYPVTDVNLTDTDYFGIKATGRVENTSDETETMTKVVVILYNASDEPIGILFTYIMEDLAPGTKVGFEATAMSLPNDIIANSVVRFEAMAYPQQFQF